MRSTITKTKFILQTCGLAFLLFFANTAVAQLIPISLEQRIEKSTIIFEGKVVGHTSYWDDSKSSIYTSYVIDVSKLFKGKLSNNYLEIITRGGRVGNRMEQVTNTLELKIGDTGIFTGIDNLTKITTQTNLQKITPYAGIQGFIKYDPENGTARDVFNTYKNISTELYSKIFAQTKTNFKAINKVN